MTNGKKRTDEYERRKQSRLHKLGMSNPRCSGCGETDWRVFEGHHIAGRKHDPLEAPMCANCHRRLSDDQRDHPKVNDAADAYLARIGNFLMGLADLFELILERLREFGAALIERANQQLLTKGAGK